MGLQARRGSALGVVLTQWCLTAPARLILRRRARCTDTRVDIDPTVVEQSLDRGHVAKGDGLMERLRAVHILNTWVCSRALEQPAREAVLAGLRGHVQRRRTGKRVWCVDRGAPAQQQLDDGGMAGGSSQMQRGPAAAVGDERRLLVEQLVAKSAAPRHCGEMHERGAGLVIDQIDALAVSHPARDLVPHALARLLQEREAARLVFSLSAEEGCVGVL